MSERALPSPLLLLQQSIEAIAANPVGYLLAGLGPSLLIVPLAIGLVVFAYGALLVGALPGYFLDSGTLAAVGSMSLFVVGMLVAMALLTMVVAPVYAGLMRALDGAQQGNHALGFGSPFATLRVDLPKVIGVYGGTALVAILGTMMCYLPGLLAGWALEFAVPAVALDALSPGDAMRRSWEHVRANPGWSLGVFAIFVVIFMVVSQIPIVGYLVAVPLGFDFQVRAYRAAFSEA